MVEGGHKKEFGKVPEITVRVPGVTTVLGEFSHYCKGRVLCCANSSNLFVSLSEGTDNQVRMVNTMTGDKKKFLSTSLKYRKEDKWANYVKGVFQELSEKGISLGGYDIMFSGVVLNSDGATLAAAMSVGVCVALNDMCNLGLSLDDIALICYKTCTCYCGEVTKYSTVMVMLKAQAGHYFMFDMNSHEIKYLPDPFADDRNCILAVDSCVPPVALREEIIHKHSLVKDAMSLLKAKAQTTSVRDIPISDLTERVIPLDEESRRICKAVLEDSQLVTVIERAVRLHDVQQIGKTLTRAAITMRDDLDISCPEMDWIAKRASEIPMCYGAGIVFNGEAPHVALVMTANSPDKYMEKLEDYDRIFGFKANTEVFTPKGCFEILK